MYYKIDFDFPDRLFKGKYEFHIAKEIRKKYNVNEELFSLSGNIIFQNMNAVRSFVFSVNKLRLDKDKVSNGEVYGAGLLDEIYHFILREYESQANPKVFEKALEHISQKFGEEKVRKLLFNFTDVFPPLQVYLGKVSSFDYINSFFENRSNKEIILEELMLVYFANFNPANKKLKEFFDENYLDEKENYLDVIGELNNFFLTQPTFGPDNQDIFTMLISPIMKNPESLWDQLEYIREKWGIILRDFLLNKIMTSKDIMKEETKFESFGGGGIPSVVPVYKGIVSEADNLILGKSLYKYALDSEKDYHEPEKFTPDIHWMPQIVMIAKNTYVWLDQLSKKYGREIKTLDQIPDEELDLLASWNFNGLWLIGIWERSEASKRIKHIMGNIDAVASAYSLYDYIIANDLGGEEAYANLNFRAKQRGIRLASDMVPNHTGIYSKWVIEHPEYFIQTKTCPFPNYKFTGENLSHDNNIEIRIEDGYYSKSDAAVVFQRIDKRTNDISYIYHGNDGTNMPWNDTAQLNMIDANVREAVIQKIFEVARKFSIIRFDAAMTLTKRHFSRLWYPQPGKGGDIPSRSDFSMSSEEFDEKFPNEFWREVVDRINSELPDTLLLAEAFWLMEGYFVRSLGMHRVYNSAFMHMMMKEENDKYRDLITNTLEYEPEILKRYVNFMSNPDEETAIKQFGTDDKYFGVLTMMICLPGLPMFAHGQIEGYTEKYGMEYKRAYYNEIPKDWLINRHKFQTFPVMKKRYLFAEVNNFWFYDFIDNFGNINENVFAFTNSYGNEKTLVLYNNKYDHAEGKIFHSCPKLVNGENGKYLATKSLIEALGIKKDEHVFYFFFDEISKKHFIYHYSDFIDGLFIHLNGFEHRVFITISEIHDSRGIFKTIHDRYVNIPIDDIDRLIDDIRFEPTHGAFINILNREGFDEIKNRLVINPQKDDDEIITRFLNKYNLFLIELSYVSPKKVSVNLSCEQFELILKVTQKINFMIQLKLDDSLETRLANYKFLPVSKDANYNENLFLFLIIASIESIKINELNTFSIMDNFNLNKPVNDLLLTLGRGDFGVERELNLIISVLSFMINISEAFNSSQTFQFNEKKIEEVFYEELGKSINSISTSKFLLVNEYKGVIYFSKERCEEFIDWITFVLMIKLLLAEKLDFSDEVLFNDRLLFIKKINSKLKEMANKSGYKLSLLIEGLENKKESGK